MTEELSTNRRKSTPCPGGDENCPHLDEVTRLRAEVKQLAKMVRTDELGLFNFRYFNRALSLEMERTRRSGQTVCLIMCDLDHFETSTTSTAMKWEIWYWRTSPVLSAERSGVWISPVDTGAGICAHSA